MVKEIILPAKECALLVLIDGSPEELYVCECKLLCGDKKHPLGMAPLEEFVQDFLKGIVGKKNSFVTLLGSTCAISVQHREDHIIFKYVDADNNPLGNSILDESDKNKWLEILAELKTLI